MGTIAYRLKATVTRAGFGLRDWTSKKDIRVSKSFGPDAVEFTQTMDIGEFLLLPVWWLVLVLGSS